MQSKEKAQQLIKQFTPHVKLWDCYHDCPLLEDHAKEAALICVKELISNADELSYMEYGSKSYWQEVEKEIKLL